MRFHVLLLVPAFTLPAAAQQADVAAQAQALVAQGRLPDALVAVTTALTQGTGDRRALRLLQADIHTRLGQPVEALSALEGLDDGSVEADIAFGRAYLAQADALVGHERPAREIDDAMLAANTHLERAATTSPSGRAVWEFGQFVLYRYEEVDTAMSLAEAALAKDPRDAEALLLRGAAGAYVYFAAVQANDVDGANAAWARAVADLEQANSILPRERHEPLTQLTWFYEAQNVADKAVAAAKALAERQPQPDFSILFRLAEKYRDQRRFEPSGRALEAIVNMSARDLTALVRASADPNAVASKLSGSIHPFYERDDKATCRAILAALVAADPTDPLIWDNYAIICTETSRFDDAVIAYERKIALDPDDPRTYNDLGTVYQAYLQKEPEKAKALFEKCVALADAQIAQADLDPARKAHALEAKNIATTNLASSRGSSGRGLLDSMVSGLRSLNLPKADGDGAAAEGTEGAGAGGSTPAPAEGAGGGAAEDDADGDAGDGD